MQFTRMSSVHTRNKAALSVYRAAQYNFDLDELKRSMSAVFQPDALVQLAHPLGTLSSPLALVDEVYADLYRAIPAF